MTALGHTLALGETAEVVAERYMVSRADQDAFALIKPTARCRSNAGGAL